jgi:hypothetical protein
MSKLHSYVSQRDYKTTGIVTMTIALNEEDTVVSQFSTSEIKAFPPSHLILADTSTSLL